MTPPLSPAPYPTHRLIPSRFPPIGLFDTVATAADLDAVMELAGWTNDRLTASRIARLPQSEWVYGRANASIVMASFIHVAPGGMRFNGPELGAWYAASEIVTAVVEVGHHLRREAVATGLSEMVRVYRDYGARLAGAYVDIRGAAAAMLDIYASDSYAASQLFGESVRASGGAGIIYDSVRRRGGINIVAHRPTNVLEVAQADHFEIRAAVAPRRIEARLISMLSSETGAAAQD